MLKCLVPVGIVALVGGLFSLMMVAHNEGTADRYEAQARLVLSR